jgi:translation factor GUF1, mitochondrial
VNVCAGYKLLLYFIKISAKTGKGVEELMDAIVERVPPPPVENNSEFRGLIFDSWFDKYKGVIVLVYLAGGSISAGQTITSIHTNISYDVKAVGILRPDEQQVSTLLVQPNLINNSTRSKQKRIS